MFSRLLDTFLNWAFPNRVTLRRPPSLYRGYPGSYRNLFINIAILSGDER